MNLFVRVPQAPSETAINTFANTLSGRVLTRTSNGYDDLRAVAMSNWDHRPEILVRPSDALDVARAIRFAATNNLEIAVRCGGHSTCGHSGGHSAMVIDLRDLTSMEFHANNEWMWAGAGLTAGQVTQAAEQRQVMVGFGDSGGVGIGGLTLGGGIGYLVRKHGLTIDSLLAVKIVTADAQVIIADEHNHADLFWALRGGGGNFGVVTRFKYKLHSLAQFTGGPMVFSPSADTLSRIVDLLHQAPEELSAIVMVMRAPPMPFLPPEAHGQVVILAMMAFAGPSEAAQKALAPFSALEGVLANLVGPAPYSSMYLPEDPALKPAVSVRTNFLKAFGRTEAEKMIQSVTSAPGMHIAQVRVLGGAAAKVPSAATAFAHRDHPFMIAFLALGASGAQEVENEAWTQEWLSHMGEGTGAYVNFLGQEGVSRLHDAYPEPTWNRLRQVKRQYDSGNLFHLNHNIPPA